MVGFGLAAVGHENVIGVARIVPGRCRATSNSIGSGHETATGVARLGGVSVVVGFWLDGVGHENAIGVAWIVPGRHRATSNLTRSGHENIRKCDRCRTD